MTAKKLDCQQVCDILNENIKIEGFAVSIRHRIDVTKDIARDSDVNCNKLTDHLFDSSALGFINMLVDEPIAMATCSVTGDAVEIEDGIMFIPLSKANEFLTAEGK